MRTKRIGKSFRITQSAAGGKDSKNIKQELQIVGRVRDIQYTIQGSGVSTGGGAISGFAREAPANMAAILKLSGNYTPSGRLRVIHEAPGDELYWPGAFLSNVLSTILTTSAGASATDPIRAVISNFLFNPAHAFGPMTWIDSRLYTTLDVFVQWAADADYATTNLSDLTGLELEISVIEEVGRIGSPHLPHFEPAMVWKDHPSTTANTQLTNDSEVTWDGLAIAWFFRQHDDSAAGNSERVDGLGRRVTGKQGGRNFIDNKDIQSIIRDTQKDFPLGLTTSQPAGVYAIEMDPWLDSREGPAVIQRDTASTNPAGITAVAAAAGDKLVSMVLVAEPNRAMDREMESD